MNLKYGKWVQKYLSNTNNCVVSERATGKKGYLTVYPTSRFPPEYGPAFPDLCAGTGGVARESCTLGLLLQGQEVMAGYSLSPVHRHAPLVRFSVPYLSSFENRKGKWVLEALLPKAPFWLMGTDVDLR